VPVPPASVNATCVHCPVGSWVDEVTRCSAPEPPVVMAKRGPRPSLTVRYMFRVVPEPKSNSRE
jgi:hypothetical protein